MKALRLLNTDNTGKVAAKSAKNAKGIKFQSRKASKQNGTKFFMLTKEHEK